MSSINLTRDEARARAATVEIAHYRVRLDLTDGTGNPGTTHFRSDTHIEFGARPGSATVVDLRDAVDIEAMLNGTALDVDTAYASETGLRLTDLAASNTLAVTATLPYSVTGEGLHRFVDPLDENVYLYSQFETGDAKRVFACFDQPDLKATYDLTVLAPADWEVVANTPATVIDHPSGGREHHFATTKPLSTYLIAVIAGPYAKVESTYDGHCGGKPVHIPLGLYCRASLAEHLDAQRLFTETRQGFDHFHQAFGIVYPFEKYDQLFVPEFNAGAMENAGAVTFRDEYVFHSRVTRYLYERRAETLLHEMAHMWFGDLVTMRWWDDLWLNESFATWASVYAQAEATEYTHAWTTFANIEKAWAYRQDRLPSTHPIAADMVDLETVDANFDGITYAKGASVLKQLVAYVGLESFLTGLREYFRAHAFGNAVFADLLAALEAASGRDLSAWGDQWLRTTGLNTLNCEYELDAAGRFTTFTVLQGPATPGAGEMRTHRIAVGVYASTNRPGELVGDNMLTRIHRVELDVSGKRTPVPALVGVDAGDLVLVNDDDLTYCDMLLDPRSLGVVLERLGEFADPLARTLCWSATWEMTRAGTLRARDYLTVVRHGLSAETQIGVMQRVIGQAQMALDHYAEDGWAAETGWQGLADCLLHLAREAEPGSDRQLAFVTGLAGCILAAEHLDVFGAILYRSASDVGLDGLVVDTEMRWTALLALVANGGAGETEIGAELDHDPSATGRLHAATARAARPESAAKVELSTALLDPSRTWGNAELRAHLGGLRPVGQSTLLGEAGHTARYFVGIADLWRARGGEIAQAVAAGAYPTWDLSDGALAAADALLADPATPTALCRFLREGRDEVVRARRCRAADGR